MTKEIIDYMKTLKLKKFSIFLLIVIFIMLIKTESTKERTFYVENSSNACSGNDFNISRYVNIGGDTGDDYVTISEEKASSDREDNCIKIKKVNYYNNIIIKEKTITNLSELRNFILNNLEVMNDNISFKYTGSEDNKKVKEELADIFTINNTGKPVDSAKILIYRNRKFSLKIKYTSTREIQTKVDALVDEWIEKNIKLDMDDYTKIKLIHDFIIANSEYTCGINTMNNGYSVYDMSSIILSSGGVCNAYADLFQVMATKSGVISQKVIGSATNSSQSGSHAWNIVNINGKNYHVDSTWDDVIGFKGGQVIYDYFLKNDTEMSKTHHWNRKKYPSSYESYNTGLKHCVYNIDLKQMKINN